MTNPNTVWKALNEHATQRADGMWEFNETPWHAYSEDRIYTLES